MGDIPGTDRAFDATERALPTPFNENRANPEMFGAGAGENATRTGGEAGRISLEYQEKTNAAVAEGAFAKAQQAYNDIIANPQTGYMSLKGGDALEKGQQYRQKFSDAIDQIKASLTPEQLREVGFRLDRNVKQPGLAVSESHERSQHDVLAEANFRGSEIATTDNIAQLAGSPGTDPESRKQQAVLMNQAVNDLVESARNRAVYKYGQNAPVDAIKSEALPLLNKAAVTAMNEAIATGDPKHAQGTLMTFGSYLGAHAKMYVSAVNKMLAQKEITTESERILGGAIDAVPLPPGANGQAGGSIARVNEARLATLLSKAPDSEHRAEILKAVDQKVQALGDVWRKTVAQQVDAAKTEGDPKAMGQFDMSLVSPTRRVWLQQHDDGALISLAALQNRQDAIDRADARAENREKVAALKQTSLAGSSAVHAQIVDKENRGRLAQVSPEEFQSLLLKGLDFNGDLLPGPLTQPDLSKLVTTYRQAQKDAGTNALDEKPELTVKASIARAAENDPDAIKDLNQRFFSVITEKAKQYVAKHKTTVTTEELAKYVDHELAYGTVKGSGWVFNDSMRRVEAQAKAAEYAGKVFVPDDAEGGEAETLVRPPPGEELSRQGGERVSQTVTYTYGPRQPPKITTQAEYDALPPGTSYIDSEGKPATKRAK